MLLVGNRVTGYCFIYSMDDDVIRNGKYYAQVDATGYWADATTVRIVSAHPSWDIAHAETYICAVIRGRWKGHYCTVSDESLIIPKDQLRAFKVIQQLNKSVGQR